MGRLFHSKKAKEMFYVTNKNMYFHFVILTRRYGEAFYPLLLFEKRK